MSPPGSVVSSSRRIFQVRLNQETCKIASIATKPTEDCIEVLFSEEEYLYRLMDTVHMPRRVALRQAYQLIN